MVFKKPKMIFFTSIIGLALITVAGTIFLLATTGKNYILPMVIFIYFLPAMGISVYAIWLDNKHMNRLFDIFREECRPEEAYPEFEKLLAARCSRPQVRATMKVNYSVALCVGGQFQMALSHLKSVEPVGRGKRTLYILALNNQINCLWALGDIEAAQVCLDKLILAYKEIPQTAGMYRVLQNTRELIMKKEYLLELSKGNYAAAETYYRHELLLAHTKLETVSGNYMLALCLSGMGRTQEAAQAYAYVAENGGTTWYAGAARQALAHMQAQPQ